MSHLLREWLYTTAAFLIFVLVIFLAVWLEQWWRWRKGKTIGETYMIVLAILATLAAIIWSCIVVMANGMSDAPMMGFQGGLTLVAAWLAVMAFWLAWWVG